MKYHHILPLVAVAAAAVVPQDLQDQTQLVLQDQRHHDSLWETLPGRQDIMHSIEHIADSIGQTLDTAMEALARAGGRLVGSLLDDLEPVEERRPRGKKGGHHSIYDLIQNSRHSRRFARLVDEFDHIRKRLEDDRREYTVFVPTDEAFKHLPEHERPSREFLEKVLEYHIVPGAYSAGRIMNAHTIPTVMEERALGNFAQRLRVSVGLFGVHLNFFSKIIASNILASNGIVHVVDNLLIPPPRQGKLIDSLPTKFSTLSLAMEKTGLGEDLHGRPQRGGTVFAPTNYAWTKLGPKLNGFLFSSQGTKYLRALLRYHVVVNETLYSDEIYEGKGRSRPLCGVEHDDCDDVNDDDRERHGGRDRRHRPHYPPRRADDLLELEDYDVQDEAYYSEFVETGRRRRHDCLDDEDGDGDIEICRGDDERRRRHRHHRHGSDVSFIPPDHWHVELPTLLRDRTINVNINREMGLTSMTANSRAHVSVQDGIARDGVVQVVESVLMPPKHRRHDEQDDEEDDYEYDNMSIDELKERLRRFVDDDRDGDGGGDNDGDRRGRHEDDDDEDEDENRRRREHDGRRRDGGDRGHRDDRRHGDLDWDDDGRDGRDRDERRDRDDRGRDHRRDGRSRDGRRDDWDRDGRRRDGRRDL